MRVLLGLAALAGAYVLAAKVGLSLASVNPSASAVWPPSGLAVGAAVVFGPLVAPAVFLGAFVANVTTAGTVATSLAIACGNTAEALLVAWLVRRHAKGRDALTTAEGVFRFAAAAAVGTMVSPLVGVSALYAGGFVASGSVVAVAVTWWLGDLVGILLLAPLFILLAGRSRVIGGRVEAVALVALAVVAGVVVFTPLTPIGRAHFPLTFVVVPPLLWAAYRGGPPVAAAASVAVGVVATLGTVSGGGPFAAYDPDLALPLLQALLGVSALSALGLGALVRERHEAHVALETKVEERTAELKRALEVLEDAQALAGLGAWHWDARRDEFTATPQLRDLIGVDAEAAPRTLEEALAFVHPDDLSRMRALAGDMGAHGGDSVTDLQLLRPDGTVRALTTRTRAVVVDGEVVALHGVALDVTELRSALAKASDNDRLRELDAMKTRFLSSAAHELATPLTPLKIQVHLLKRAAVEGRLADQARALDVLERNLDRLATFVRDLLDAARLESDRMVLNHRPHDIAVLAEEAVESFAPAAAARGVDIRLDVPSGLVVDGDAQRLVQVVFNLLSNALKFSSPGGVIRVEGHGDDAEVTLSVSDEGEGIDPARIAELFRPFRQVHDATRRTEPGTGLGLFICRGIVERHGGRIKCDSAGRGRGATFTVTLPRTHPVQDICFA